MEASIRETCEELLISESNIKLYGPLDYFLSPAGLRIDPYLGELVNYDGQYSNDEVSEIFTVPLAFFQNTPPKCYYNKVTMYPTDNFPFDKVPGGREYLGHVGNMRFYSMNMMDISYGDLRRRSCIII